MINTSWPRPLHLLLFPEFGSSSPIETHPLRHRRCISFPLQPFETHWLGKDLQFWISPLVCDRKQTRILHAIVIHGFQLLDIWFHDSAGNNTNCQRSKLLDISTAGSFCEWKGILIRNLGFLLDIMTLLMALCHYVHIWWLHGMKFHLVDVVLFLNICALLGAIVKHIKGFIRLKIALGALHRALPDATPEEIEAYDDECAICRELMAKEFEARKSDLWRKHTTESIAAKV
ncbi:E3 ubiquitin protein ligase RIN2 [Camellia lanceoleosa]|uniref:E3 ubiquitin protein ligase RIN2 n=1 Tax=Camellia lanceoleosa TaxID=1840588 RepID=A0ACC0INC0_9ERIC|nr:E3 ubiquitin protein ligase RIN2 [Camellia lanceoleosa]